MANKSSSALDLNPDLHERVLAAAEAEHCTVDQFPGELLRIHRDQKQKASEYDVWFDSEVEQALGEADDPSVRRVPDEIVRSDLERRMTSLRNRI